MRDQRTVDVEPRFLGFATFLGLCVVLTPTAWAGRLKSFEDSARSAGVHFPKPMASTPAASAAKHATWITEHQLRILACMRAGIELGDCVERGFFRYDNAKALRAYYDAVGTKTDNELADAKNREQTLNAARIALEKESRALSSSSELALVFEIEREEYDFNKAAFPLLPAAPTWGSDLRIELTADPTVLAQQLPMTEAEAKKHVGFGVLWYVIVIGKIGEFTTEPSGNRGKGVNATVKIAVEHVVVATQDAKLRHSGREGWEAEAIAAFPFSQAAVEPNPTKPASPSLKRKPAVASRQKPTLRTRLDWHAFPKAAARKMLEDAWWISSEDVRLLWFGTSRSMAEEIPFESELGRDKVFAEEFRRSAGKSGLDEFTRKSLVQHELEILRDRYQAIRGQRLFAVKTNNRLGPYDFSKKAFPIWWAEGDACMPPQCDRTGKGRTEGLKRGLTYIPLIDSAHSKLKPLPDGQPVYFDDDDMGLSFIYEKSLAVFPQELPMENERAEKYLKDDSARSMFSYVVFSISEATTVNGRHVLLGRPQATVFTDARGLVLGSLQPDAVEP